MKRTYTQEQIAKCRLEYKKGKTLSRISQEQNIPRSTVARWIKRYDGLPIYPPGYPYVSHKINCQDAHLQKLEDICTILRQVQCSVDSPLKVKLYEMEKLAGLYPVHTLCAALCVDRGTFYNHLKRNKKENSSYVLRRKEFSFKIKAIYDESNGILGSYKIHHILRERGDTISLKMVKKLMQEMGLRSIRSATIKERKKEKRARIKKENLLKNVFTANAPNQIWVSDITQYCFLDYRVFICVILDLFSRKVIAYKVSKKQTTQLVASTFQMAYGSRLPKEFIFHSDRGCQYTANSFQKKLELANAVQSFSRPGTPGDNSVMESFFSTLKNNNVKYAYDSKRRLQTVELNGKVDYVKYTYTETNSDDEIITTNANNQTLTVKKDKRGKVLSSIYSNGLKLFCTYDEKDRLITVTEENGETTVRSFAYTYDSLDNVLTYNEKEGTATKLTETYAYNEFGQVDTITLNTGMEYKYTYSEDSTRRLEEISVAGLTITPKYDILNRNKGKEICIGTNKLSEEQITYRKVGDHATNMPSTVRFGNKVNGQFVLRDSIKYAYDAIGNITTIYENGKQIVSYEYDKLNRLVRENNKKRNETKLFAYDNNGNILLKEEYDYTVKAANELGTAKIINEYCYKEYSDQLLSIIKNTLQEDGNYAETIENFVYDETIGNPTTYRGKTATWTNGRRLASYDGHTFTYDTQGRRIAKDNVSFTYDSNGRVVKQSNGLEFFYDHTGVAGLKYNGATYVYRKDAQGNIIAIINQSGNVVVEYTYDAWGNHTFDDVSGVGLGELNPFRYRGYYYDTGTKLYFLKTRYYDPEIGRFMTIDGIEYLDPETINGLNLYAYCGNNPVSNVDPNGNDWWHWLISGLQIVAGIVLVATGVGAGLGASLIVGGTLGIAGNIVGSQIAGGLGSMANGWGAISTGLSLFSYNWVAAIAMIIVGAGTMIFGTNEVVAGVTGTNYIQEWTGMSDSLYNGLYLGLNIASSVGTIAGRLGMRMYSTSQVSTRGTSHTGQKPYSKIINMREGKITYFDGKGNAYWSRHNRLHSGLVGNPHWHTEIGGHGPEQSYIKMLFRLILKSFWR